MAELVSRNTKNIVVTEANRPRVRTDSKIAAAVNRLRAKVSISDLDLDENAGVATMSVPDHVNLDDVQNLVGADFVISLNQKLQY